MLPRGPEIRYSGGDVSRGDGAANPNMRSTQTFPEGKRAAISFTFDDGSREHADVAARLLDDCGFRGTFFVIAGLTRETRAEPLAADRVRSWWAEVSWEEWREAAARGHEIGNHSLTHPVGGLAKVEDDGQLRAEVEDSARLIAEKIGRAPVSFAYPYNKTSARVRALVARHHPAIREDQARYGGRWFSLAGANRLVDRAIRKGQWLVPMIHGIGGGWDPLDAELFRRHLRYIKEREAEIWVDTFGAISRHFNQS
jgi:peptidoglycan/xylan/chitin deacetylase (PgdA/CDA1 family)